MGMTWGMLKATAEQPRAFATAACCSVVTPSITTHTAQRDPHVTCHKATSRVQVGGARTRAGEVALCSVLLPTEGLDGVHITRGRHPQAVEPGERGDA